MLDVPLAETVGRANASIGLEFFVGRDRAGWGALPLPLSIVAGLGDGFDLGFSAQFGGQPGDAGIFPAPVLQWTVAAKYSILRGVGWRPLLSLEAVLDRPTANLRTALRAVASTRPLGPFRVTSFAGAEIGLTLASLRPTAGLAVLARHSSGIEGLAEVLYSSGGALVGVGARWGFTEHVGVSATATWIPQESSLRLSVGLGVFLGQPSLDAPPVIAEPEPEASGQVTVGPRKYLDDRPQLRLKIRQPRAVGDLAGRHYQYEPYGEADRADGDEAKKAPVAPPSPVPVVPSPPTPEIPQ